SKLHRGDTAAVDYVIKGQGQAGPRRLCSGSPAKQLAGVLTAPARRPALHVHLGAPLHPPAPGEATCVEAVTTRAQQAVSAAWHTAVRALAGGRNRNRTGRDHV
ncbi:hypothetical protein GPJ59_26830, partial [Streptomyces bambusae]|nr:hypothetical protein [Streptomyces bambusae]